MGVSFGNEIDTYVNHGPVILNLPTPIHVGLWAARIVACASLTKQPEVADRLPVPALWLKQSGIVWRD